MPSSRGFETRNLKKLSMWLYLIAYSLFSDCACWLSFSILKSSSSSSKDSTTVRFFCLAFLGVDLRMGFCEKNCLSFLSDFLSGEKTDAQKAKQFWIF